MVIDISINYDIFLKMVFVVYVFASLANLFTGIFKTEKNIKTHNGWVEIAGGLLMFVVVAISILY